jgi:hypothetical protein
MAIFVKGLPEKQALNRCYVAFSVRGIGWALTRRRDADRRAIPEMKD